MKKEKIILATVYLQDDFIGFEYTDDCNLSEVNYFLESYLKNQRRVFERGFREVNKNDN